MQVKCKHCGAEVPFCYVDAHMEIVHELRTFNGEIMTDLKELNEVTEDCAAPSDPSNCSDVNCDICGKPIDEFGDALAVIYDYSVLAEEFQEFARHHPGKKIEFETIVRCSVVNDDSFDADEMVVYAGPIMDSDALVD